MSNDSLAFVRVHPAAESDRHKMNEILKAEPGYIEGLELTASDWQSNGEVQFFYCLPENMPPEEQSKAEQLIKKVYTAFTATRSTQMPTG